MIANIPAKQQTETTVGSAVVYVTVLIPSSPCRPLSQIATLNFLDAFLRIRSQVVAPSDAFTAVELWMGVVHVYTCQDSLNTCQVRTGAHQRTKPGRGQSHSWRAYVRELIGKQLRASSVTCTYICPRILL